MCVKPSASDFIAARFGESRLTPSCRHGTEQEHGASEAGAVVKILFACQIVLVEGFRTEGIVSFAMVRHRHSHFSEQINEVVDVQDVGNVCHSHLLCGQQGGADDLQSFVLGSLRSDFSFEAVSAFDDEGTHVFQRLMGEEKTDRGGACRKRSMFSRKGFVFL